MITETDFVNNTIFLFISVWISFSDYEFEILDNLSTIFYLPFSYYLQKIEIIDWIIYYF